MGRLILFPDAILKANDEVSVIMMDYKRKVEGIVENGQGDKKGILSARLQLDIWWELKDNFLQFSIKT